MSGPRRVLITLLMNNVSLDQSCLAKGQKNENALVLEQYSRHVFFFSFSALLVSAICLQKRVKTVLNISNTVYSYTVR